MTLSDDLAMCSICLERLGPSAGLSRTRTPAPTSTLTTPCGHAFHSRCMEAYCEAAAAAHDAGGLRCPICRAPLLRPLAQVVTSVEAPARASGHAGHARVCCVVALRLGIGLVLGGVLVLVLHRSMV